MSETETASRDEATGQFTPSTEGLFGREAELAKAGFTMKKDPSPEEAKTYADDIDGLKEAATDLKAKRGEGPVELSVDEYRETIGKPDPKEAVTPEQAAKELSRTRAHVSQFVEGFNLQAFADSIDKARAEIIKAKPESADELGLSKEDVRAAKEADGEEIADKPKRPDTVIKPDDPTAATVEGLAPEVEAALKHPQVRQAIQEELGRAEQSQQQYAAAVNYANQFAQASLVDALPELGQIPVENWEAAIGLLAQSDPQRVQRAMGVIDRVARASAAQVEIAQHRAIQQRQQFVASTEREDARLVEMLGDDAANAANAATVSFLTERGIPRHEALQFFQKHPLMATAEARVVVWKADQYDKIKNSAKTMSAQPLPPVQRPGVSTGRSPASDSKGKIAALQAQLEGATGNKAAKIAAQIRSLKRSA